MKNWWLFCFFSCMGTGYLFSMQQAVENRNWFGVVKLLRESSETELKTYVQVLLNTTQDLNTCTGNNEPTDGELDSGLFGVLLRYSFDNIHVAYALQELIRAKKIDVSLSNNKAVVDALDRSFKSVHGGSKPMPAYRSYLSNGTCFPRNIVLIVCGIVACACAYTWYTAQDEEDSEESIDG